MATVIDKAVEFAVEIANDDTHGYDQTNRWCPDYDCSSLLITAWENSGVPVKTNGASTTSNMYNVFIACGFKDVTSSVNLTPGTTDLQKGDVLLVPGSHTAMMINKQSLVHARLNENGTVTGGTTGDQTGNEICVQTYYNAPWTYVLRYPGGSTGGTITVSKSDVINSNAYLSDEQMKKNAEYICKYLLNKGWTLNGICGMLGNMETESTMNPGIWESLNEGNTERGFGLVQWTPATKLIEWCNSKGLNYKDIDAQLERILYELESGIQYYSTEEYPLSFKEFSTSTMPVSYLAMAFLYNYERPSDYNQPQRSSDATKWYNYFLTNYPDLNNGSSSGQYIKRNNKFNFLFVQANRRNLNRRKKHEKRRIYH